MSVTVNKLDYIYKKLLHEAKQKMNDTVEISDEEYGIIYKNYYTIYRKNITLNLLDKNPNYLTNNDFNDGDIICIMLNNIDEYKLIGEDPTDNHLRTYGYMNNIEGYNKSGYGTDIDKLENKINGDDDITNYLWIVEKYEGHLKFKNYKSQKYITYDPNLVSYDNSGQPIYTENIDNNIINYLWDIEYSSIYETHYCGIKNLENNNWNGGWNDIYQRNAEVQLYNKSLGLDTGNKLVIYKVNINENIINDPIVDPVNPIEPVVDPSEEDDHDYSQDYLTFEALEDGTFSFVGNDLYYSTNNGTSWKSLAAGTETELITAGTKVLWKGDANISLHGSSYSDINDGIGIFSSTGQFNIMGNILSLLKNNYNWLNNDENYLFGNKYKCVFKSLFENCIKLISAQNLILYDKLSIGCYHSMFKGCTSLIVAPKLSSTNLANYCYSYMFNGCTSLIKAPELLVTNLKNVQTVNGGPVPGSYYTNMFNECTSLNYIKCIAENITSTNITDWVKNVPVGGIFIKHPNAIFDIGDSGIPVGWEVIDEVVSEEGE